MRRIVNPRRPDRLQDTTKAAPAYTCVVRPTGQVQHGLTAVSARVTVFVGLVANAAPPDLGDEPFPPKTGLDGQTHFAPTLLGHAQPARPFLYREIPEYGGQQSVRVGDWKAVRQKMNPGPKQPLKPGPVELYDLATDPHEATDVAKAHPDVVAKLGALLREQHTPSAVFPIRALDAK